MERTTLAKDIEEAMLSLADEKKAKLLMRFFKTGKGEYGEGDKFLGITNPKTRSVVKEAWKDTPLNDAVKLVNCEWHEIRLCGLLIMVAQFEKAVKMKCEETQRQIVDAYLSLHTKINNWDLVDLSAPRIVGGWTVSHPEDSRMDEWIKDGHTLWQKRISIVSTWLPIRHGVYKPTFDRAVTLLDTKEDLLQKAAGWMLREVGKQCGEDILREFLDRYVYDMPSTMLRYAIEKLDEDERREWLIRRRCKNI